MIESCASFAECWSGNRSQCHQQQHQQRQHPGHGLCRSLLILRKTRPELHRAFRCPAVPLVPILGAVVCLGMMAVLDRETWERLFIWLAIGLVIYFGYGCHHSKLRAKSKG